MMLLIKRIKKEKSHTNAIPLIDILSFFPGECTVQYFVDNLSREEVGLC